MLTVGNRSYMKQELVGDVTREMLKHGLVLHGHKLKHVRFQLNAINRFFFFQL